MKGLVLIGQAFSIIEKKRESFEEKSPAVPALPLSIKGERNFDNVFLFYEGEHFFDGSPIMREPGHLRLPSEFVMFLKPGMKCPWDYEMYDGHLE